MKKRAASFVGTLVLVVLGACVAAPVTRPAASEAVGTPPVAEAGAVTVMASVPAAATGTAPEPAAEPLPAPASEPAPLAAPGPEAATASSPPSGSACNDQVPQNFLIRGNFLRTPDGNKRAIQYRTDHYGYFPGFGHPGAGAQPAKDFVVETTFMGLKVRMHQKVAPALACVEAEIKSTCGDHPYKAHALAGIRYRNTYRGGEVTNHAYGIAIDVDPDRNTCCGCVPPWNDAPRCKRPAKSEYDRMEMPECWVHAFERFGFYWLGHDVLRDTMHFEFLGDPDRIVRP